MKKSFSKMLIGCMLAAAMCFSTACDNGSSANKPTPEKPGPSTPVDPDKPDTPVDPDKPATTYTITFTDRGKTVATYTKEKGEKVAVPEAPTHEDNRYKFTGWEGLGSNATEVTVYGNATYDANWNEMFGSETQFTAMQRNSVKSITYDGEGDDEAWADATAYNLDEAGSTVKFLWDEDGIYLFANVKKENATEADKLNVLVDLLHSDKLASDTWDGQGWGGSYRGEPGPMVEGGYTIAANTNSDGAIEKSWEWLSNSGGDLAIGSKIIDDGYTVEFKIGTTNGAIGEYKPHAGQEIGLSVKTTDGASALESFNGYASHGPKSLSNVLLVQNTANINFLWSVKEVRENYEVVVDGKEDLLYKKDAGEFTVGNDGTKVKALWSQNGKIYLLATLGSSTTSLKVEAFGGSVEFTASGEKELVATEDLKIDAWGEFKLTVNGTATESYIRLVRNDDNFGRNMHTAKQLASGTTITLDGVKDAAYDTTAALLIETVSAEENEGTPAAKGEAWILWDDDYLYVFVEVTDSDISTKQIGDPYANDSVEVWLDTCQQLPATTAGYGESNRPVSLYRGELGYRVVAGQIGNDTWSHWLGDDERTRPSAASKVADNRLSYTVEYKIPWGKKVDDLDDGFANYIPALDAHIGDENYTKVGQIVDIMININDDNGQDGKREGIVSLNSKGSNAWQWAGVLDQLKLLGAD